MKSILIFFIIALLCACAFANNQGGLCLPAPFNLTHTYNTQIIVPGVIDVYAGYQVSINGLTTAATVTIQGASITFTAQCNRTRTVTFSAQIPDGTYTLSASQAWNPSDLFLSAFQTGGIKTTAVCGTGKPYYVTSASLNGGLLASETTLPVSIRFIYFAFIDLSLYAPSVVPSASRSAAATRSKTAAVTRSKTAPATHSKSPRGHHHRVGKGRSDDDDDDNNNNQHHWNSNNVQVGFGDNDYCSPKDVYPLPCLSLSGAPVPPSLSVLASGTPTSTLPPSSQPSMSSTVSGSTTNTLSITNSPSITSTKSLTNTRTHFTAIPASIGLRKFLKRG